MLVFVAIVMLTASGRLAIAEPIPNWRVGGMAIPLTRQSSFLDYNNSINLDEISSHGLLIREKILRGLENYEMNTGTTHPLAVEQGEFKLGTRMASAPLTTSQYNMWMVEISIGSPPKTLRVHIDTGAADTWVLETGCWGISGNHDFWDPHLSKYALIQEDPFQLGYSDGTRVKGNRYTDNVTIAGFTANAQMFGSVMWYTSHYECGADGLLGLAFPSVSDLGGYPLFVSLVRQNKLINPTISLKFSSSGGEMYIGGSNSMLYNGKITYTHLTHPGFWHVVMDDLRVNGNKVFEDVPVVLDTGASYIFGDWDRVSELYVYLGGTLKEHNGFGFYYLPCDSFPTLSLTFGGKPFEISPEALKLHPIKEGSLLCISAVIAQRSRIEHWNIGMVFLQGVYSVFDYGASQVGFAELA